MLNRGNLLIIAIALAGALLGLWTGMRFNQPQLTTPSAAISDLQLADMNGQSHRLSDWNGKVVLVNFWATWCGPCREEMPLLDRTRSDLADKGVEVIGIAVDDSDAVAAFLKDNPVQYPILVGSDTNTLYKFGDGSGVLPYSVLLDRTGKLVAQRAGSFSPDNLSRWLQPHLAQ